MNIQQNSIDERDEDLAKSIDININQEDILMLPDGQKANLQAFQKILETISENLSPG